MKHLMKKGLLIAGMLIVSALSVFAEDVKTSSGEVVGTCTIESSEIKYDSRGGENIWVRVKVKNNTGKRLFCTVYGNNGGKAEFIVDPYDSAYQYLDNCHEQPSYLICDNARVKS